MFFVFFTAKLMWHYCYYVTTVALVVTCSNRIDLVIVVEGLVTLVVEVVVTIVVLAVMAIITLVICSVVVVLLL